MDRTLFQQSIEHAFLVNPVVALLGPRQCGKTTLAKTYIQTLNHKLGAYFDLERPSDLARLANPELVLSRLSGLIAIDEIQHSPELFRTLRVLVDNTNHEQKYLILGSASRELLRQSSESLAGRISYIELTPFNFSETGNLETLWLRGGFPKSYLANTSEISYQWRENYIRTYLEVDIPNLGINILPANLRRFWTMLSHYHGNIFNASEIGRSMGLSHNTIRDYADILSHTFMIRQLQPWHENIKKRQVKSPKIYFRDSGLLHALLSIKTIDELWQHPKLGASWEGFALEEIIRAKKVNHQDCYFWATHANAELDLLIIKEGKKLGYEFKFTDSPKLTKSMGIALQDLQLDELTVIYPGKHQFPLSDKITAYGLELFLHSL